MPPVEKFQRWVDLLVALISHRAGLTFDDLSRKVPFFRNALDGAGANVESVKRTFERDKDELKALGVPIDTLGEPGSEDMRYRIRSTDFYLPYLAVVTPRGRQEPDHVDRYGYQSLQSLAFHPDELLAIAEAASRARQLGDPALLLEIESAMKKLSFDLPLDGLAAAGTHVVAPRAAADPETLEQLGEALLHRKRVRMDYHTMETDEHTSRTVEPWGLFWSSAHWYLAARDMEKDQVRNFRVSRVSRVQLDNRRLATPDYTIPATFDLSAHARTRQPWELGDSDAVEAIVEVRRDTGAAVAAASLGQRVDGEPGHRRFLVRRPDAFARWLLSSAGGLVPVRPEPIVEEYGRQLAATLSLYESAEVDP